MDSINQENNQIDLVRKDRLVSMFMSAPIGFSINDSLNGTMYEVNEHFGKILGRELSEIKNLDWMSITHPDDIQPGIDLMKRLNAGEIEKFELDKRFILPSGGLVYTRITVQSLGLDKVGRKIHLTMIQDLTAEVEAERKLKIAEQRLNLTLQAGDIGYWDWDIVNDKGYANEKLCEQFNIPVEQGRTGEMMKRYTEAIHKDDKERVSYEINEALKSGVYNSIYRIQVNGKTSYVRANGFVEYDEEGKAVRFPGVIQDITHEKMTQYEQDAFRYAIEQLPLPVLITTTEGNIEYVNKEFAASHGYSQEELIDQNPRILRSEVHKDEFYSDLWSSILENKPFSAEIINKTKGGEEIPLSITISPISFRNDLGEEHFYYLAIYRDLRISKELTATREKLHVNEVLLKEIHHRVKNNLQLIGSLMNLQESRVDNQLVREVFNESRLRIRAISLVHEKLYSNENMAQINLRSYLNELATYLISVFMGNKHAKIENEIEEIHVGVDEAVTLGLLCNEIITNCVKYAFENADQPKLQLSSRIEGDYLHILIKDNGKGIEDIHSKESGDTLGMTIITSLAKQLKGDAQFYNEKGLCVDISISKEYIH